MHTESMMLKSVVAMLWLVTTALLMTACTSAQQSGITASPALDNPYRQIHLVVDLAEPADTVALTTNLTRRFSERGIAITRTLPGGVKPDSPQAGLAILRIEELGREIVTDRYHRTYPRYPLTANRGWKTADKPLITLRATLTDGQSGAVVFAADYVNEGPWYADSAAVVGALARTLPEQLQREGYLSASPGR